MATPESEYEKTLLENGQPSPSESNDLQLSIEDFELLDPVIKIQVLTSIELLGNMIKASAAISKAPKP